MWVLKNVELTLIMPTTISKHYVSMLNQSYALQDLDGKYRSSTSSATSLSDTHALKKAHKCQS